jgi:hypothetical protein
VVRGNVVIFREIVFLHEDGEVEKDELANVQR